MPDTNETEPKGKTYYLKEIETQLLVIIHNNQQAIFSAVLSAIAADRLAYNVTPNTQFKLGPKMDNIEIIELPPPPVPTAKAANLPVEDTTPATPPTPPEEPTSGAVAAA